MAFFIIFLGSYFKVFELYELQTYDWRFRLRGSRPVSDKIVLIDVYDDTLRQLGQWPLNREYHSNLIDILSEYGAKAVVMDFLFTDPHPDDAFVAASAKNAKNVYFAYALGPHESKGGRIRTSEVISPLVGSYAEAARGVGHVNVKADKDGKRRRVPLMVFQDDKTHYQVSFLVALDILGVPRDSVRLLPGKRIDLGTFGSIPLDPDGYFLVSFAGKWAETFQHYSYIDVLYSYVQLSQGEKPRIDLSKLRDKICVVGLTATASHDTNPIPLEPVYPQVGTHANVINGILQKDFIRQLDRKANAAILMALGFIILFISRRRKPWIAFLSVLAVMTLFTAAVVAFYFYGLWIDLFYPLVVFVLIYTVSTLGRVIFEIKKRELIENELKIASAIQRSFLPASLPEEPGLSLAVTMRPAKAVGGDLYTFIRLGPGKLGVMVGDVSGKGTPAALFMAKVVSEFKYHAVNNEDPSQVLEKLNDAISSESTGGLFVTMTYAIFDRGAGKLVFSNGGHLPVVWAMADGGSQLLTAEEGMPIGVMGGIPFGRFESPIKTGDCFAFYSDGVSEARNKKVEEYGIDRLQAELAKNRAPLAEPILKETVEDLNRFMGKAEQHDDITLLIVKVTDVAK